MAGKQILNNNAVTSGMIPASKNTPHYEILVSHSALFCIVTPCCLAYVCVYVCMCVCVYIHIYIYTYIYIYICIHTGCPRRNVKYFGRVFLMLNYTDITQNTYIQSWMVTEIMAREVWNFDSCYTLTDYQIHIETGRNMWFL